MIEKMARFEELDRLMREIGCAYRVIDGALSVELDTAEKIATVESLLLHQECRVALFAQLLEQARVALCSGKEYEQV